MPSRHRTLNNLSAALKAVRHARGFTQEDFGLVSSRTYISSLERGTKSPTLGKIEQIASVMGVHPLALLALAYAKDPGSADALSLMDKVQKEVSELDIQAK